MNRAFVHTQRRLKERYGFDITLDDFNDLGRVIRNSSGKFFKERRSNQTSVHEIIYKGLVVKLVYNNKHSKVITALPRI